MIRNPGKSLLFPLGGELTIADMQEGQRQAERVSHGGSNTTIKTPAHKTNRTTHAVILARVSGDKALMQSGLSLLQ